MVSTLRSDTRDTAWRWRPGRGRRWRNGSQMERRIILSPRFRFRARRWGCTTAAPGSCRSRERTTRCWTGYRKSSSQLAVRRWQETRSLNPERSRTCNRVSCKLPHAANRTRRILMSLFGLIEYEQASPEVRAVYDDIMATRKTDWINNFWKAIAHDPVMLKRTWADIKQIMAPGALDPLTKEMIYVAVSVTNQCEYCIASHTASAQKKGMTEAQFKELMSVVGMANETNRLVAGYQVEVDERFKPPLEK